MLFCCLLTFYKINFAQKNFRNTTRAPNSLDPDKDCHSVGPEQGPNCLQMLSADDKSRGQQGKINDTYNKYFPNTVNGKEISKKVEIFSFKCL